MEPVLLRATNHAHWFTLSPERQITRRRRESRYGKVYLGAVESELPDHGPIGQQIITRVLNLEDVLELDISCYMLKINIARLNKVEDVIQGVLRILEEIFNTHLELKDLRNDHTN